MSFPLETPPVGVVFRVLVKVQASLPEGFLWAFGDETAMERCISLLLATRTLNGTARLFDLLASLRAGVLVTEYFSRRVRLVAPTNLGSLTVYHHRSQVQDKAINQTGGQGQGGKHDTDLRSK